MTETMRYATTDNLTLFADGRPDQITAWCRENLINPQITHDFLHEVSHITAAMVRRIMSRSGTGPDRFPEATWGFIPVGEVDRSEMVALQLLSAAMNRDVEIVDAHVHAVIDRGIQDPTWIALVLGECILQAGRWVRALRESVST